MLQRYVSAAASGTVMTLGLFYVMQLLIATQVFEVKQRPRTELGLTQVRTETPLRQREELPDREQLTEVPKTLPNPDPTVDPLHVGVGTTRPQAPGPIDDDFGSFAGDGPLVAMFRVEPTYPPSAAERGLEGHVIVEFDVMADGTVSNVRVVESSHSVFERNSIRAAERFRFKARVVDGVAQPTYGLRNLFRFNIDD